MHAVAFKDNVFGAAQPDTFSAEFAGDGRVVGRVSVGPHTHGAELVGPLHQSREIITKLGIDERSLTFDHLAAGAINCQPVSASNTRAVGPEFVLTVVDHDFVRADYARLAPSAGHHCRMGTWSPRRG